MTGRSGQVYILVNILHLIHQLSSFWSLVPTQKLEQFSSHTFF